MSELQHFEIVGDHGEYRPTGQFSLAQAVQLITSAIAFAREQQVGKLLVVTTGLTNFKSPGLAERYFIIREWAKAAGYSVHVAVVARPEMIDAHKFGVTVAVNIGFIANVFASEDAALAWLQSAK